MAAEFIKPAQRLKALGSAVFSHMDQLRQEIESSGSTIINLGIGSPDQPPPEHIKLTLQRAVEEDINYGYTLTQGIETFRQSVVRWYARRFGVELDPESEVLSLMGSQDGLAHIFTAFIDPGELALIPDPGYPIYTAGLLMAGGRKFALPLRAENNFLPDFSEVPDEIARQAKLMFLNYPNNPVAATADLEFFEKVVKFATEFEILVCHDNAYSELAYDSYRPPSFLQATRAKEIGVEFHSVSKSYNMAGCRLGFVVGNARVIKALSVVKSNIDYGVFRAVQLAGVAALDGPQSILAENSARYQRRRDVLLDSLDAAGWHIPRPKGSMFVWAPLPGAVKSSYSFAEDLLKQAGVLVIPGVAFGEQGEGYVRMALVQEPAIMQEAAYRIHKFLSENPKY